MPTPLSSALATKVKADKLTLTALAEELDVSVPSATAALRGKSFPNKTTAPKFAKFLGISVEELMTMKKGKSAAKAKPAAKVSKAKPSSKSKTVKAKRTKPTKSSGSITLAEAAELAADDLAVAVYRATADQRRVITAVLGYDPPSYMLMIMTHSRPWSHRSQHLLRKAVTDLIFVKSMLSRDISVIQLRLWITQNEVPTSSRANMRCWLEDWAHANPQHSIDIRS